jgi:hypothetical protein
MTDIGTAMTTAARDGTGLFCHPQCPLCQKPQGQYDPHMGKPGPGQPARDPFDTDAHRKFMRSLG